jgi:hypothetical protein
MGCILINAAEGAIVTTFQIKQSLLMKPQVKPKCKHKKVTETSTGSIGNYCCLFRKPFPKLWLLLRYKAELWLACR